MREIVQESNEVRGDIAARDIYKNTNLNFGDNSQGYSQMSILLNKFQQEQQKDVKFQSFIEELEHYNNPLKNEPVIGLEAKLALAGRESFLEYGLRVKEEYTKKLLKYQFSEAAQQINVHLLALVESYFMNNIYPLIYKGESETTINMMIDELIIKPLLRELEQNHLSFTAKEINGMLYFLTGNCHIKWTK
jgi:hypothetical protein